MAQACFPAAVASDERVPMIVVGFGQVGSHEKSRDLSRAICIQLALHNITCVDLEARRSPYHQHSFRKIMQTRSCWIQKSDVYCPIIDTVSFFHEQSLLELYYGLRGAILSHHPVVIPILESDLMLISSVLLDRERGVTPSAVAPHLMRVIETVDRLPYVARAILETVPWLCQTCSTISTDCSPEVVATKLVNYCREVNLVSAEQIGLRGIADTYEQAFRVFAPCKRPNTAVMRILRTIASRTEALALSKLSLSNLLMGTLGCLSLAPLLRQLPMLELVDLRGNGIECTGVRALCQHLATHPTAAHLLLDDNLVAAAGLSDLYFLALENGRVVSLSLSRNIVSSSVWLTRIEAILARNGSMHTSRKFDNADIILAEAQPRRAVLNLEVAVEKSLVTVSGSFTSELGDQDLPCGPISDEESIAQLAAKRFVAGFLPCNMLSISRVGGSSIKIVVDSDIAGDWIEAANPDATIHLPDPGLLTTVAVIVSALSRRCNPFADSLRAVMESGHRLFCSVRVSNTPELSGSSDFSNKMRFVEAVFLLTVSGNSFSCGGSSIAQVFREQMNECCGSFSKEIEVLLRRLHAHDSKQSIDEILACELQVELASQQQADLAAQEQVTSLWKR